MEKNLRVFIITLLFAATVVSFITSGGDVEEPKDVDPKAKITGIIQKAGIPVSNLLITDGKQAKLALNITEVDIPDTQKISLVIYATPDTLQKYDAANLVVFTVFENHNETQGVLLFDTTRRAKDLLTTTLVYANRDVVNQNRESGLSDTQIYNNYQFFTLTKSQVVGASKALLETLTGYNILSTQAGVIKGDKLKESFLGADLTDIADDDTVAYVSYVPQGEIEEKDYLSVITQIGFEVDPSIGVVVVNNQLALQSDGMVSLYYTDRASYEKDMATMEKSLTFTHVEYPWEETDAPAE